MGAFRLGSVTGPTGVGIAYRVSSGPADRPALLLIHGWAQSQRCWGDALLDRLAADRTVIAMDMRGHGASSAPPGDTARGEGFDEAAFASDVRAVLDAEAGPAGAILAGWSYGGLVACDHLAVHGTDGIAGLVLIGAITSLGRGLRGGTIGSAMRAALPDALSDDPRTAVRALGSFGTALVPAHAEGLGATRQLLFGTSLATPPAVRAGVFARTVDHDAVLSSLPVPVLIVHGEDDTVVDVAAGRHAESLLPTVTAHYWSGEGHAPFLTDPDRFAGEFEAYAAEAVVPA
ncbi:alpha/beta fold hydrolase [Williamsia sterculiae]|uniref:Non-heme chloroperoxidase n=1 Tax=Williamsia sterculiae TaxID=1344003 RepID=A0A1N7CVA7_9NOCA|nr:alpha/beta fold hydrolase [Williamsia sterculiae]SIR67499.1 non-heme chloroperoxidase [Williamsia sterculiae]